MIGKRSLSMKRYTGTQSHLSIYPDPISLNVGDKVGYGKEDIEYPKMRHNNIPTF